MTPHARLVSSGRLDGALDPASVAAWPEWARRHADTCPVCQALLRAAADLDQAASVEPGLGPFDTPGPAPSLRTLQQRRRRAAPALTADDLAAGLPPFALPRRARTPEHRLEVGASSEAVHAIDPDARTLLVFSVAPGGTARLLASAQATTVGVDVVVPYAPAPREWLVAVSALAELDAPLWQLWTQRCARQASPTFEAVAGRVHVVAVRVPGVPGPERLRVAAEHLPEVNPAVRTLFREGKRQAQLGNAEEGYRRYAEARALAAELGDRSGVQRAELGMAMTLSDQGFAEEALRRFAHIVETEEIDPISIVNLGGGIAWALMATGEYAAGLQWVDACVALDPSRVTTAGTALARALGEWERSLAYDAMLADDALSPAATSIRCAQKALTLLRLGRTAEARALGPRIVLTPDLSPDSHLVCRLAQMELGVGDEAGLVAAAQALAQKRERPFPNEIDRRGILEVARWLRAAGHERTADAVLRTLFRVPSRAALVGIAADAAGGVVVRRLANAPTESGRVVDTPARPPLQALVREVRRAMLLGSGRPSAGAELARLVFGRGYVPPTLEVVTDGTLAGLPWQALTVRADGTLAAVTEWIFGRTGGPEADAVVSVGGDDLGAGRVEPSVAALRALPPVGLLHLPVPATRTGGIPALAFAEGPTSAGELAELALRGRPVVLLAGCATAEGGTPVGAEHSLPRAFLHAGAGAVIGTRWPLTDDEAAVLFDPLRAAGPTHDPAGAVAALAARLRREGHPPRVWAALAVYR